MILQQLMLLAVLLFIAATIPLSESNGRNVNNDYYESYDNPGYEYQEPKKPDNRIPCYLCNYMPDDTHPQGDERCDEPFDDRLDIPHTMCNESCALTQIFRIVGNRTEKVMVSRGCLSRCREITTPHKVVRCCNKRLCNSFNSASLPFYFGVYAVTLTLLCITLLQNLLP